MDNDRRAEVYARQTGRHRTPRQRRRLKHKANRALRVIRDVLAGGRR